MKYITKLSFIAASLAMLGTSAALADDPQLQNRLMTQRTQAPSGERATTVAVYAVKGLASGRTDRASQKETTIAFAGHSKSLERGNKAERGGQRWMAVATPHGTVNYFAPAK